MRFHFVRTATALASMAAACACGAAAPHAPLADDAAESSLEPEPGPASGAPRAAAGDALSTAADASARDGSRQPLAPLEAEGTLIDLPVARHRAAVLAVPRGATSARPVIVVTHGAGGQAEWDCRLWSSMLEGRGFVLCPRGFPINRYLPDEQTGFFYPDHHALGREITEALAALRARFPAHADLDAPAYAGFSQGAIMGALLLPIHPAKFGRAALVEGGYGLFHEWSVPAAARFVKNGGQRVLLACGSVRCVEQARTTAAYMSRGGLRAVVLHAEGAGHSYGGTMAPAVREALAWLFEGDPRWTSG